jgi:hypothetical protein
VTDYCPHDHPYEGDNLRISSIGRRICMTCRRASNRRSDAKRRAQAKTGNPADHDNSNPHREYVCEEVAFLAGTDTPEQIAVRLGYAEFDTMRTVLKRWGRADLVKRLERTTT